MLKLDSVLQALAWHITSTFNTWRSSYQGVESKSSMSWLLLHHCLDSIFLKALKVRSMHVWVNTPNSCTTVITERELATSGWPDHGKVSRWRHPSPVVNSSLCPQDVTNTARAHTCSCNRKSSRALLRFPNSSWLYLPLVARRWSHATWSVDADNILLRRQDLYLRYSGNLSSELPEKKAGNAVCLDEETWKKEGWPWALSCEDGPVDKAVCHPQQARNQG